MSECWTDLVDRGGLIHISDTVSIEGKLQRQDNLQCDDVQFYWSIVSANWIVEEAEQLLKMCVQQLRGFSFVSSFMET